MQLGEFHAFTLLAQRKLALANYRGACQEQIGQSLMQKLRKLSLIVQLLSGAH